MLRLLVIACLLAPIVSFAQYQNYKIGVKGDTLNAVDMQGQKQGKWIVKVAALRGEPGYEEEGVFKNDKKEGIWRKYSMMGDVIAIENYRWGNKDGAQYYYNLNGSVRDESWRAINPDNPYDTVEVPDPIDKYKVTMVVVKVEGSAIKHGVWRYYDDSNGRFQRSETYFMGKLDDGKNQMKKDVQNTVDSAMEVRKKLSDENKPKEIQDYDKKNSGKKKLKVREGRAGY